MKRSTSTVLMASFCAALLLPAIAAADDAATQPASPAPGTAAQADALAGPPGAPPPQLFSGILSQMFTTAYYKRGYLQEDKGLIYEPLLNLNFDPFHNIGPISDLSFNIGARESIHTKDSHANGSPRAWYESDGWFGFSATAINRLKLDCNYVAIDSPNAGFAMIQEVDSQLTFLDDGLLGPVTFHPYVSVVKEIRNSAAGAPEGTYLELGAEPAFPLIMSRTFPVRMSFPTVVGLSSHNYYKLVTPFGTVTPDETFGYAQVGVSLTMPLTFVPHKFGMVFVTTGVDYLMLDHNLTLVNKNSGHNLIGRVTLGWAF